VGVEPFEFTSNGGGGEALLRRVKRRRATFYEVVNHRVIMYRIIARLDIKGDKLIKSVQLDGVRVVGDPKESAQKYYMQGADEILLMDAVASLYGRNHLEDVIKYTAENIFIPMTVGGGIRKLKDVDMILKAGADKVAINTAAVSTPELITHVSRQFGAQCMVLQIDAKQKATGKWEAYVDGGREPTGLDVVKWAKQGVELGAGEILLTSVDNEGTGLGFDTNLCKVVSRAVTVPVIACGGMGSVQDLIDVIRLGRADAVAMANILHVEKVELNKVKFEAHISGIPVRIQ
jgi:imidazole glycerol-phosphate synthase subunit HisF